MVRANRRLMPLAAATLLTLLLVVFPLVHPGNAQTEESNSQSSLRYYLTPANSARGKQLFVNKGCVVCHSVNNAGGDAGPPLDIDPSNRTVDVFGFAARMWKGAKEMVALQVFSARLRGSENLQ